MKITSKDIQEVLDYCYDAAIEGSIPGSESVSEMADSYLKGAGTLENKIDDMINWQVCKCTTSGFLTSLGGLLTLPVAIPANISSVLYVQIRMVCAVAYMTGYNIKDDKVKAFVYACLCGTACENVLKETGIKLAEKMSEALIKKVSAETVREINKKVGFRLLTKFGEKGMINLVKMIPIVSGVVGGGFDYVSTVTIGKQAKRVFYKGNLKKM